MFSESMLNTSWGQHTRRSGATVTSFMLQLAVIGVLVTVPLLNSVGIPLARIVSTPITSADTARDQKLRFDHTRARSA